MFNLFTNSVYGFFVIDEFEFSPNPYFENDVLRKEFQFSGTILESATARLVHEDFTDITWKAGKDLTQKQTDANKSTQSTKPAASFFGLFIRGARLDEDAFNIHLTIWVLFRCLKIQNGLINLLAQVLTWGE